MFVRCCTGQVLLLRRIHCILRRGPLWDLGAGFSELYVACAWEYLFCVRFRLSWLLFVPSFRQWAMLCWILLPRWFHQCSTFRLPIGAVQPRWILHVLGLLRRALWGKCRLDIGSVLWALWPWAVRVLLRIDVVVLFGRLHRGVSRAKS